MSLLCVAILLLGSGALVAGMPSEANDEPSPKLMATSPTGVKKVSREVQESAESTTPHTGEEDPRLLRLKHAESDKPIIVDERPSVCDIVYLEAPSAETPILGSVYKHSPTKVNGKVTFDPEDGRIGHWRNGIYVTPGEEGVSLLAAHVSDVFGGLETIPVGSEVILSDSCGHTIVLEVDIVDSFPKDNVPWDTLKHVEDGASVTHLITCRTAEYGVYTSGPNRGRSLYNYFVTTRLNRIEWEGEGGDSLVFLA